MTKFKEWLHGGNGSGDQEDTWNAAIDAAMEAAIDAAHPNRWIRVGMALNRMKS